MDIISAYREVGSYRAATAICETTPKTARRLIERHEAGGVGAEREPRQRNDDPVADLVTAKIAETEARTSTKRLLTRSGGGAQRASAPSSPTATPRPRVPPATPWSSPWSSPCPRSRPALWPTTPSPRAGTHHDRYRATTARGGPRSRPQTAQARRDAPPGSGTTGHRPTHRWHPRELLRTLVEAEIAAREASNTINRRSAAEFPVEKSLDELDVGVSSIPRATFDYLTGLEWVRCRMGPRDG